MMAPNGPMKFCAGRLGDETWLNQIHDGTSFGVNEISARKSRVPTPSRIRAKTSFHALLLTGRATPAHSSPAGWPFNLIPAKKTLNAQRRTSNAEGNFVDEAPIDLRLLKFDIGRWTLGVRRFLPLSFLPLHVLTPGAYCASLMRSFLRKTALVTALVSLVFFLSCERHHVGELPEEQATEHHPKTGDHEKSAPAEHHHDLKADQPATTNHSHTAQTPEPRNSPANFFPDKPKP
jgi:hypothetical protein